MIRKFIWIFIIGLISLSSCTSLLYRNKFNKIDNDYKLKISDTIVIGSIIFNDQSVSKKYSDSIYIKLKRAGFANLIHPDSIKIKLYANKIYALPTVFPQDLCGDLYKVLKTKCYLNSFVLTYNEADFDKNGEISVQFDLYDLINRKIIWSCNSSVSLLVPEKDPDSNIDLRGIASIDSAFDKLLKNVIKIELKK